MKMVFNGICPYIVTELGRCFEPKEVYEISTDDVIILSSKHIFVLFSEEETAQSKKKGKQDV